LRDSKDCTATKKTTARTARLAEQQDRKKKKEKTRRKRTGIASAWRLAFVEIRLLMDDLI